jgi:predicted nucleotidyltransferase
MADETPSRERSLLELVHLSGFAQPESLIHLFVGGSELHGAKIGKTDDTDLYGVFVESPAQTLGLDSLEHYVWSSAGDDRRNGPDDVDVTLYSLRKWAVLAAKGNATTLHFLFAEPEEVTPEFWRKIQDRRADFLSRKSAEQFVRFAENQFARITGEKGSGKKGQRPEYIGKFGYDTKAAMHGLRLLYECIELMLHGQITLPRPEKDLLIEVRSGEWTLEKVLDHVAELRQKADLAVAESPLPEQVDRNVISEIVAEVHMDFWKAKR